MKNHTTPVKNLSYSSFFKSTDSSANVYTNEIAYNDYYNYLLFAFIIFLTLSNIAVTKLCNFFGNSMPGGMIFFPFLYVINDVVTEVYGFRKGRRMIIAGLISTILINLLLYVVVLIPSAPGFENNDAFHKIFSLSPRIFLASLASYFVGENINSFILTILKIKYSGRVFVFRAIISTLIGSLIEGSLFFCFIFYGTLPLGAIFEMAIKTSLVKMIVEILVMPISVYIIYIIKSHKDYIRP